MPFNSALRTGRRALIAAAGLAFAMLAGAQSASALEFRVIEHEDTRYNLIKISGDFEPGDTEKFEAFHAQLPQRPTIVFLESGGGAMVEGFRLGLYFRTNRIVTVVDGKDECHSSCSLAFLGGTDVNGNPRRVLSASSKLGFHMFRRGFDVRGYSSTEMEETLEGTKTTLVVLIKYLREVGGAGFFAFMMSARPEGMYVINRDEALGNGIVWLDESGQLVEPKTASPGV
jgi:hypothetical protein